MPAARLAAERRTEEELERLRDGDPGRAAAARHPSEQFVYNHDFHSCVIDGVRQRAALDRGAAGLRRAADATSRARGSAARFHRAINEHHREIAAAIEAGDADAAGGEMHDHLEYLRPYYERGLAHDAR